MIEIFEMAIKNRDSKLAKASLAEMMAQAAQEAGWHQVEVPNLQHKNKLQVRYTKAFSSAVTAELICRIRPAIISYLKKREYDPKTISSHIGYGVFKFIQTYKPLIHNNDEIILASVFRAIKTKVEQSNRKEIFKFRPGYVGASEKEKVQAEQEGRSPRARYTSVPREISLNTPVYDKNSDQSGELGDFISNAPDFSVEVVSEYDLEREYANDDLEKIFIKILIDFGSSGKVSRPELTKEALRHREVYEILEDEFGKDYLSEEEAEELLTRKVRVFFKTLKRRLQIDFNF